MAVSVQHGRKSYTLLWRVNMADRQRHYESDVFCLEGSEWRLLLETEVNSRHGEEDWKMYLRKTRPNEGFHTLLISIYIEDKTKKLECLNFSRATFAKPGGEQIMWRRISNIVFKFPDIKLDGNVVFLLTLLSDYRYMAELESHTDNKLVQTPRYLEVCPCLDSLSMDIQKLYLNGSETDIELHCCGRALQAHRTILTARSEVFAAMLQNDMSEKNKGFIDIVDMELSVLEHFLKYLYTGTLPELTVDLALQLYEASDKYAVAPLMARCSDLLKEHLTEENACSLLVLADTHNDDNLREFIISYIIRKDILTHMYDEDAFQACHPKLAVDVLYRAYKSAKRCCSTK